MDDADKVRVLLLTARVGQGHLSAAEAIAQALANSYAEVALPMVVNVLDHPDTPQVLHEGQSDYDKIATDWARLHDLVRWMTDFEITRGVTEMAHIMMLYKPISKIIEEHRL